MHLVGFIIRIYHDARSSECQMNIILCNVRPLSRGHDKAFNILQGNRKKLEHAQFTRIPENMSTEMQ